MLLEDPRNNKLPRQLLVLQGWWRSWAQNRRILWSEMRRAPTTSQDGCARERSKGQNTGESPWPRNIWNVKDIRRTVCCAESTAIATSSWGWLQNQWRSQYYCTPGKDETCSSYFKGLEGRKRKGWHESPATGKSTSRSSWGAYSSLTRLHFCLQASSMRWKAHQRRRWTIRKRLPKQKQKSHCWKWRECIRASIWKIREWSRKLNHSRKELSNNGIATVENSWKEFGCKTIGLPRPASPNSHNALGRYVQST